MAEKPLLDNDRFLGGEKFFYRDKSLFAVCGEYRIAAAGGSYDTLAIRASFYNRDRLFFGRNDDTTRHGNACAIGKRDYRRPVGKHARRSGRRSENVYSARRQRVRKTRVYKVVVGNRGKRNSRRFGGVRHRRNVARIAVERSEKSFCGQSSYQIRLVSVPRYRLCDGKRPRSFTRDEYFQLFSPRRWGNACTSRRRRRLPRPFSRRNRTRRPQ